jgi:hypothetical protein
LGLTSGQEKILCGDLMFSGHTVVLATMYFTQLHYTPRGLTILRYISTPITFLGIAALVVSGGHYTMDVLIAYWLTSHVFWGYHQVVNTCIELLILDLQLSFSSKVSYELNLIFFVAINLTWYQNY